MPSVEELERRRCSKGLVRIIEQIPPRFQVRSPMVLDEESLLALALWTMLRWERTPLMVGLEVIGIDVWALTRDVDAFLVDRRRVGERLVAMNVVVQQSTGMLDQRINQMLNKVEEESKALGHDFLGEEHLLLAILSGADVGLTEVLFRHGVSKGRVSELVRQLFSDDYQVSQGRRVPVARLVEEKSQPFSFTSWDSEATGVPRRFGMSIMFMMMTMYALLFAFMQVMGTPPVVFGVIAVFVTAVGFAQMALFGGKYPRAASIWSGAVILPIEIAVLIVANAVVFGRGTIPQSIAMSVAWAIPCALAGAFCGYLSGGLTAGAFLLIDMYNARYKKTEIQPDPDSDSPPDEESNTEEESNAADEPIAEVELVPEKTPDDNN